VRVPAGAFIVGCNDAVGESCFGGDAELPAGQETLPGFFIDRTEVTAEAYGACVSAGACRDPDCGSASPQHPVVCVSWGDARDYCRWRGARLPSEREWEKAARGTDGRIWPTGNTAPDCSQANLRNCRGQAWPAGSEPGTASPYGALDMAGNVEEWTADWFDAAAQQRRVYRGGNWGLGARVARASNRSGVGPAGRGVDLGVRCAQSL
jgi:serine/threonine-protein kinase